MKKVIIGIHGLGNKPEETILHDWWLNAIHEGLERIGKPRKNIPFKMVYWAGISYSEPLDPAITDSADPLFLKEPYYSRSDLSTRSYGSAAAYACVQIHRRAYRPAVPEKKPDRKVSRGQREDH